jgi:hypothetical protein
MIVVDRRAHGRGCGEGDGGSARKTSLTLSGLTDAILAFSPVSRTLGSPPAALPLDKEIKSRYRVYENLMQLKTGNSTCD